MTVHTFMSHLSGARAEPGVCSHQLRAELPSCGGGESPSCRETGGTQDFARCLSPTVKLKDAHLSMQIFHSKCFHC